MRAIVLDGSGRVTVAVVPAPEPGPGEALIDIRYAGICGTDLQLARGYMGFTGIPGHEFVGTVAAVTSHADRLLTGARVTGEINLGCEECSLCSQGLTRHCRRRRVLGLLNKSGAFAEQITLPVRNLHVLPDQITDSQGVFIEPIAAALEIFEQIAVRASDRALVLGDGKLGLLVGQALRGRGCDVTIAGHHEGKLALARDFGLKARIGPGDFSSEPFDLVVDATGSPDGIDLALRQVRPRGIVILKTTHAGQTPFDASRAVVDEISLIGSRCGRFEPAIEAMVAGTIRVHGLVSAEFPLDEGVEAFHRAGERGALKVLLRVTR